MPSPPKKNTPARNNTMFAVNGSDGGGGGAARIVTGSPMEAPARVKVMITEASRSAGMVMVWM
jgi:hypothetical protein